MSNMIIEDGKFVLVQNVEAAGTISKTLQTQNNFLDKNIQVVTTTPQAVVIAGATTIGVTDAESILTLSATEPASGEYITVSGQGAASVTTGGFIDQGTAIASVADTKYYVLQNATFTVDGPSVKSVQKGYVGSDVVLGTVANGAQTITGGEMSTSSSSTAIASDGCYDGSAYDTSDKIKFESGEAAGNYKITSSGTAQVARAEVDKQVTSAGYFTADANPVEAIAAGTHTVINAPEAYYVKKSTMSATSVTSSNIQQVVTISEGYAPADRTVTIEPMTEVTPTTDLANVGLNTYFVAGTVGDNDVSLTPRYSTAAGYVAAHTDTNNGGVEYYKIITTGITETDTTVSGGIATRGTASWGTGWITSGTMDVATFNNVPSNNKTYVDISATTSAPVLVAGDYLYIDAGYTDDLKISLARLVPDGSDVKGHSEYILSGHSAYDNDGTLVAGSIPTYTGAYVVD